MMFAKFVSLWRDRSMILWQQVGKKGEDRVIVG
jgi:hypothetical protein